MKVALLLSGQPRHYKKGFEYIKKFILDSNKDCEIDIFTHFWFNKDDIGNGKYSHTSRTAIINNYCDDKIEVNTPQKIIDLYSPIKFKYEEQEDCNKYLKNDYSIRGNYCNPFATISQYLSFEKAILLKKEHEKDKGFEYDITFKCRFDTQLHKPIIFNNFDINKIHFPNDVKDDEYVKVNEGIFWGNNIEMNKFVKCYENFDRYWLDGCVWGNAVLIGTFLKEKEIQFDKVDVGLLTWIRK